LLNQLKRADYLIPHSNCAACHTESLPVRPNGEHMQIHPAPNDRLSLILSLADETPATADHALRLAAGSEHITRLCENRIPHIISTVKFDPLRPGVVIRFGKYNAAEKARARLLS